MRFSPLAHGCAGRARKKDGKERRYEKEREKRAREGRGRKWGKREGYRDEGPRCWWCKTETDSSGWRSKSIEQSRRGGGQPGQGESRGEGEPAQGPGSDHNAGFWHAVGNKVGLPGSAPQKKSLNHTSPEDSEGTWEGLRFVADSARRASESHTDRCQCVWKYSDFGRGQER
ncbi:unnamed protein product [Pleuronectes platessa]|uniref:Uncharacterized protein n=1 Tax=Pleuronectes platessa TaxID=8262 RepID=A0A9N7Z2B1_PLEPL|nr:unnamed protein product [Pleuronectes platessa]